MNKVFLILGVLCFLVPSGLKLMGERQQKNVIDTYEQMVEVCEEEELATCLVSARDYNKVLFELQSVMAEGETGSVYDMKYEEQLNLAKTGMMGHVIIPEIGVELPVYHGTSEDVLATGVGHLQGSSLPVGGLNTHTVLTGHNGLPELELFTRLDELEKGDVFFLKVCKEILAYQVAEIAVVEPEDVSLVKIQENRDLASLITCTPFGINTHRLVVTGERTELEQDMETILEKEEGGADETMYFIIIAGVLLVAYIVCRSIRRKHRNHRA